MLSLSHRSRIASIVVLVLLMPALHPYLAAARAQTSNTTTAQSEQDGKPEKRGQRVPLRCDVTGREHTSHQQQTQTREGNTRDIEVQLVGENPAGHHKHKSDCCNPLLAR